MYPRNPVCVKCETEFKPHKNGVGLLERVDGRAYKVWEADLYKCLSCGTEIVVGFGKEGIEHYQNPLFAAMVMGHEKDGDLYQCIYGD